jgi:hypothetical protein
VAPNPRFRRRRSRSGPADAALHARGRDALVVSGYVRAGGNLILPGAANPARARPQATPGRDVHALTEPHFETKLIDVVGLYLNPTEQAIPLCADETSQIQALDATQPSLPLTPGRAETMSHEYKMRGITNPTHTNRTERFRTITPLRPLRRTCVAGAVLTLGFVSRGRRALARVRPRPGVRSASRAGPVQRPSRER